MVPEDPLEIEVKFHLADVDSARNLILALGARSRSQVFETNVRFEDEAKSLKDQGILLRLRKDDKIRLTFKSRPAVRDRDFKIYRELEVQVDSFDTCCAILEGLGFHPEQTYEKWRETYTLGETKLLIDTMPYGVFLEIEGEKSDIRNIANQLALRWKERIVLNYLEIFEIIRRQERLPFNDVTFDHFEQTRVDITTYLPLLYAG
jgi:adenylate cyclase class 2